MKIYHSIEAFSTNKKTAVTTGTFDGVHIGHQEVIHQLTKTAKAIDGESVVLTFFPHPRMVLYPNDNSLRLINTIDERIAKLEKTGIDHLIIHPFSKEFSCLTSSEFIKSILVNQLNVATLVVGYDHRFGKDRAGSYQNLKDLAPTYHFKLEEISAQKTAEINISSTKIRTALLNGEITTANQFLGDNYTLKGTVVHGEKTGRAIGFPTANLRIDEWYKLVPANGVYAVKIKFENVIFDGMLNIGSRPTLNKNNKTTIEINIFNFNQEIYGCELEVFFIKKIRNEQKFKTLSALTQQLKIDKKHAIQIIN